MTPKFYLFALLTLVVFPLFAQQNKALQGAETTRGTATVPNKRIALLIGNQNYANKPLQNPINDVVLIEKDLKVCGFQTTRCEDLSKQKIYAAITNFAAKITAEGEGVASVLYFAGHGTTYNNKNYWIPIGEEAKCMEDLPKYAVSMDSVQQIIGKSKPDHSILFVDACRNNDYKACTRATTENTPLAQKEYKGHCVLYSTELGQTAIDGVGNNSPFALALHKALNTPNLNISELTHKIAVEMGDSTQKKQFPTLMLGEQNTPFWFKTLANKYEWIYEEKMGLRRVALNNKYGYINAKNEEIIPVQYDGALDFDTNNRTALVALPNAPGQRFYINTRGECVQDCPPQTPKK
jgi:hypothetical protein